ncbi:MAG: hypothetical protein MUF72_04480 [Elainella sp. Prado103]|nr:hypothetical protein [Elainella sp. Prado103]
MGQLLIQIEGTLLWQILADGQPARLQTLDQLLSILAGEAGSLPVHAYMAEADWDWLRQQIRCHYEFDLAEEILLRLDLIRFDQPAPTDFLYAVLQASALSPAGASTEGASDGNSEGASDGNSDSSTTLRLSLTEFLTLYTAICQLEAVYAGSDHAGSDYAGSDHAGSDYAGSDYAGSDYADREAGATQRSEIPAIVREVIQQLTAQSIEFIDRASAQDRAVLLGMALMLMWVAQLIQRDWLLSPVQAEPATEASTLAKLIQIAENWLNQAPRDWPSSIAQIPHAIGFPSAPTSTPTVATEWQPLIQPLSQAVLQAVQSVDSPANPIASGVEDEEISAPTELPSEPEDSEPKDSEPKDSEPKDRRPTAPQDRQPALPQLTQTKPSEDSTSPESPEPRPQTLPMPVPRPLPELPDRLTAPPEAPPSPSPVSPSNPEPPKPPHRSKPHRPAIADHSPADPLESRPSDQLVAGVSIESDRVIEPLQVANSFSATDSLMGETGWQTSKGWDRGEEDGVIVDSLTAGGLAVNNPAVNNPAVNNPAVNTLAVNTLAVEGQWIIVLQPSAESLPFPDRSIDRLAFNLSRWQPLLNAAALSGAAAVDRPAALESATQIGLTESLVSRLSPLLSSFLPVPEA